MRILLLTFGDVILDYVEDALTRLDHSVRRLDGRTSTPIELSTEITKVRPDLCIINDSRVFMERADGLEFEQILDKASVPVTTWHFEAPDLGGGYGARMRWTEGPFSKNILLLLTDSSYIPFYKSRDVPCGHLPLAVNDRLRLPPTSNDWSMDLVFVGSPYFSEETWPKGAILQNAEEFIDLAIQYLSWNHWAHYKILFSAREDLLNPIPQLSAQTEKAIVKAFENVNLSPSEFQGARKELRDACTSIFPAGSQPFSNLSIDSLYRVLYSYCQLHIYLDRLLKRNLKIFGGSTWTRALPQLKESPRRLSDEELYLSYRNAKIQYGLTKMSFENFVHDRTYAILYCGGFPLIDYRADLDLLFKKDEIVSYKTIEEAEDLITYYQKNETERAKIIERGRARVTQEHTYFHRTKSLVEMSKKHFGIS